MSESARQKAQDLPAQLAAAGVDVPRLCLESRKVCAGDVFLACPGHRLDGRRFIVDAVHAGAVAVLWEREGHVWDESLQVCNVAVDGLAALAGYLANEACGRPSEALWLVGVTGTNGKTTVTQTLRCISSPPRSVPVAWCACVATSPASSSPRCCWRCRWWRTTATWSSRSKAS